MICCVLTPLTTGYRHILAGTPVNSLHRGIKLGNVIILLVNLINTSITWPTSTQIAQNGGFVIYISMITPPGAHSAPPLPLNPNSTLKGIEFTLGLPKRDLSIWLSTTVNSCIHIAFCVVEFLVGCVTDMEARIKNHSMNQTLHSLIELSRRGIGY